MTAYLLRRKLFSAAARKTLDATHNRSEIILPLYNWINRDLDINEKQLSLDLRQTHLANLGTFHGFIYIHPLRPHYRLYFDQEQQVPLMSKSIKAQVEI